MAEPSPADEPAPVDPEPAVTRPPAANPAPTAPARVTRLEIRNAPSTLTLTETRDLTVSAIDAAGRARPDARPTWVSSDPGVVSVVNGRVRAEAPGTATITAAVEEGTDAVTIVVPPDRVAAVSVRPASLTLETGQTGQLTATATGAVSGTLDRAPAWASSDPRVAAVDATGLVTAMAAGTATITARADGQQAAAQVTVTPRPPTEAELRQQVTAAIQEYADAIERKDIGRIKALYPGMPAQQEAGLNDALPRMENLDVSLTVGRVLLTRDNTEATATVTGRWVFRADGANQNRPANNTFVLQRASSGHWIIMEIR